MNEGKEDPLSQIYEVAQKAWEKTNSDQKKDRIFNPNLDPETRAAIEEANRIVTIPLGEPAKFISYSVEPPLNNMETTDPKMTGLFETSYPRLIQALHSKGIEINSKESKVRILKNLPGFNGTFTIHPPVFKEGEVSGSLIIFRVVQEKRLGILPGKQWMEHVILNTTDQTVTHIGPYRGPKPDSKHPKINDPKEFQRFVDNFCEAVERSRQK